MTLNDDQRSTYPDDARSTEQQYADNELFASVARKMEDAIVMHDVDGSIRTWNKGAQQLFGYAGRAAPGFDINVLITPSDRQIYNNHVARLLQGGTNQPIEIRGVTSEGRHPDLLVQISLVPEAHYGQACVVAFIRDVSVQKGIEQKLVALIESTPDPFIIVEADGCIQRVNRQAELLFGYDRQELIGKSFKLLVPDRFRPQHDGYTRNYQVRPVMRQMGSGLELWCLTRSGEEIPVEIGLSPVVVNDETTIMVRFRDIREQKREQALLQQARQKADEANRTKSRFLAAASHDLRQPLQSVSMNLGVLAGNIRAQDKERVIAQTRMALDTTNKLLNSLLDITKLESGKVQPEIESFRIHRIIERVYNTEIQQARQKEHVFSLRTSSLAVTSDPALLEQMLTNLVANAIRYTPPQGRILLGCRRLGSHLRIEVIDNGPGIAPEALDYIFDEYRQVEQSHHYQGKGLGLGLSIVKLLAELLHLKLEVRSIPGKGSRFSILVPVTGESPAQEREQYARTTASNDELTGTLLLVDDDDAVLESTGLFLEVSGFTILMAHSSSEAMAALDTAIPDFIITDYGLAQQETGIDLLKRIRMHLGTDVPAIVITGDTSLQKNVREVIPAMQIVCKPVDSQTLLEMVKEQLTQSTGQRNSA
jgi:PAS domain S-box-containing protein